MSNPQTPVLVGISQVLQRSEDLDTALQPLDLMVQAVERAAHDAGSRALLERAGSVRVIRGVWRYQDPGRVVAARIGCPGAQTAITPYGGNFVQTTVNRSCLEIQRGDQDIVILTGAECGRTQGRLRKAGRSFAWTDAPGTPDLEIGVDVPMAHEAELARGIRKPIEMYPIFDNALRHARGESIEAHRRRISELWASFSRVASENQPSRKSLWCSASCARMRPIVASRR